MRYRVLPYRQGSRSAKALAEALGGKVLKLEGSKFKERTGDVIINWGNSSWLPQSATTCVLNHPYTIPDASNKLKFFSHLKEVKPGLTPAFWTSKEEIPDDAYPIVCRTILSGHSGAGIVIADNPESLVDCQLYVKYEKKKDEFRVHVGKKPYQQVSLDTFGDPDEADSIDGYEYQVISVQRKARRPDTSPTQVNWQVRNHSNGFIYVRNGVTPPSTVITSAKRALEASGLDFGAVDVIWNAQQEKAYALEINTAPGLEGQTVEDYVKFFSA